MSRPSSCLTSHPPGLELRSRGFDAAEDICGGLGSFLSYGLLNKFVLYVGDLYLQIQASKTVLVKKKNRTLAKAFSFNSNGTIPYDKKDPNPPQISSAASNPRERSSSPGGCEVKQLEGRDITDTAFLLEVSAKSDVSDIKLSYAIGTHRSGNNVQDWTGMTGNSLTAPVKLKKEHYGIPLFFTIKAKTCSPLVIPTAS
jgi:hypothetical protein